MMKLVNVSTIVLLFGTILADNSSESSSSEAKGAVILSTTTSSSLTKVTEETPSEIGAIWNIPKPSCLIGGFECNIGSECCSGICNVVNIGITRCMHDFYHPWLMPYTKLPASDELEKTKYTGKYGYGIYRGGYKKGGGYYRGGYGKGKGWKG